MIEPGRFLGYLLANSLTVVLVTFPFLALLGLHLARDIRENGWITPATTGALWFLMVAGATITMTSLFTFFQATYSAGEAGRLHARYYAYVYVIIIVLAFMVPNWSELAGNRVRRINMPVAVPLVALWLLLNVLGILYLAHYRVQFQDNTELFSLGGTYLTWLGDPQFPVNWIGLTLFLVTPLALLLPRPAG